MEALKKDLGRYGVNSLALIACLGMIACVVLATAVIKVGFTGNDSLLIWSLLAFVIALTSARHPLRFPGTPCSVSISEALTFLAIMMLGPYHAALLTAVDTLLVCHRLKLKPSLYLFNISNQSVSIYTAGQLYYLTYEFIKDNHLAEGIGQKLLGLALPIVVMSMVHYGIHLAAVALLSRFTFNTRIATSIIYTLPWEPVTFLAGATFAGAINFAFREHGYLVTTVTLLLAMPVPLIIYLTIKAYHDKMKEQENHYQEITSIYDSILEMLAMAIDAKDDVTHDHIQRVKLFARRMGEIVGLSELEIEALKAGALLHDIGKIGVPAHILNKPGKLTEHEFEQMKMHTIIGADMLSNVDFRYPVVPIVRHHHERWDGRGYPDGLKGEEIPITARILTLVDTYDALRSDRPYHKAMSREDTLAYVKQNAGTFYDPSLVEIFLSVVDQLEAEAANFKSPHQKRTQVSSAAMASAKPAAGLDTTPEMDRATAALNSIAEANQRVTALYEMSRTLSSILSVEDTVAILANRISKLIPFTTCVIYLADSTRSEFEAVHAAGRHAEAFFKRRQPVSAGITGYVITNQRAMYNTNPLLDLGFLGTEAGSAYKTVMAFPLIKNQEGIGAIALYSSDFDSYGSEHIQLMEAVSQPAADAIYNALAFEQAQRAVMTDPATGLANMRALTTQFDRERTRSHRLGTPLSLIVLSVKNAQEMTFETGSEQWFSMVARIIKQQVRETDLVARQATNSFIALLPDSGQAEASEVRGRIREAINRAPLASGAVVSLGSATSPGDGNSFEELFQAAQVDCIASSDSLDMPASSLEEIILNQTL